MRSVELHGFTAERKHAVSKLSSAIVRAKKSQETHEEVLERKTTARAGANRGFSSQRMPGNLQDSFGTQNNIISR